eukprot:m.8619 g.8619  ORF g.8619 m.8619 type:complete len:347 (+) comp3931_c0_seq1:179-1219(+)
MGVEPRTTGTESNTPSLEELMSWKVAELRKFLVARKVAYEALVEKKEFASAVLKSWHLPEKQDQEQQSWWKGLRSRWTSGKEETKKLTYPHFQPSNGYMTEKFRLAYIEKNINNGVLPPEAYRMKDVVSLTASNDRNKPIFYWQLFSVLGEQRIENIIREFYKRVFRDTESWFSQPFKDLGGMEHHVWAQTMMWMDTMGGGRCYHGGDYRLSFHHSRAKHILNTRGATRWMEHMNAVLTDDNNKNIDLTKDDSDRVRAALYEFLRFFMGKYAKEFRFSDKALVYGDELPLNEMQPQDIDTLTVTKIKQLLSASDIEHKHCIERDDLISLAKQHAAGGSAPEPANAS